MKEQVENENAMVCEEEEKVPFLSVVLFWGALWGIAEATIGFTLHALPFRVPTGSILFPIGCYFMSRAYNETKQTKSIFYTSFVTAIIKLVNLFIPMIPTIKVINPFMCILLEGLAVTMVVKLFDYDDGPIKYIHALIMSLSWRVGYYIVCIAITIPLGFMESSSLFEKGRFIEFFFINGFINSLIIYFFSKYIYNTEKKSRIKYTPIYSTLLLVLAFFIQWML